MSKSIPTIQKYMTVLPHTIGIDQSLAFAEKVMSQYHVRHLPVLDAGRLVGILSDRDIRLVESFKDVEAEKVKVEEAYSPDPYITKPTASLSEVCSEMIRNKYGCAIVEDHHKLVGIFTWIDALKAFSDLMESTRFKH